MIIEQIRKDMLEAMRVNPALKSFLSTLYSECMMKVKESGRKATGDLPTDEECVSVVRRFIKGANEVLAHAPETDDRYAKAAAEVGYLESMLPKLLDEAETRAAIQDIIDSFHGMPNIGVVMGSLKKAHGNTVDMKLASQIVKEMVGV